MADDKKVRIQMNVSPEQKKLLTDCAKTLGLTLSGFMIYSAMEKLGEVIGDNLVDNIRKASEK